MEQAFWIWNFHHTFASFGQFKSHLFPKGFSSMAVSLKMADLLLTALVNG